MGSWRKSWGQAWGWDSILQAVGPWQCYNRPVACMTRWVSEMWVSWPLGGD